MIQTVLFDIDNTLYSYDAAHKVAFLAVLDYAEQELGIPQEKFRMVYQQVKQQLEQTMQGQAVMHNRLIRYQNILEQLGISLHPHALNLYDIYWDTLLEASVPEKGALKTLQELRKMGIRIGVGTDMTALIQFRKLTHLGLLSFLDFMVTSEEALAEKPSEAFFRLCVEKSGCKPQECVFIGDSLEKDVQGANRAGMHGVWYRAGVHEKGQNMMRQDVIEVTELKQLIPLIQQLNS